MQTAKKESKKVSFETFKRNFEMNYTAHLTYKLHPAKVKEINGFI